MNKNLSSKGNTLRIKLADFHSTPSSHPTGGTQKMSSALNRTINEFFLGKAFIALK